MDVFVENKRVMISKKQEILLRQVATGLRALKELGISKVLVIQGRKITEISPEIYKHFFIYDTSSVVDNDVPSLESAMEEAENG